MIFESNIPQHVIRSRTSLGRSASSLAVGAECWCTRGCQAPVNFLTTYIYNLTREKTHQMHCRDPFYKITFHRNFLCAIKTRRGVPVLNKEILRLPLFLKLSVLITNL